MKSQRRRILLVETNDDGTVGGSHRAMHDLVRRLDRHRYEPVVLFYQQNRYVSSHRRLGLEVHVWDPPLRWRGLRSPGAVATATVRAASRVATCMRFLRKERIALVHLNNSPLTNFEDWLPASRALRVPCISHARGMEGHRPGPLGQRLARRFDRVIAVSRYVADSMKAAGIPESAIELIYDGVDPDELQGALRKDPTEVRSMLQVPPGKTLLVMIGHLRPWKGHDVVLDGLAQLAPELRQNLQVLFVGGRPAGEEEYCRSLETAVHEQGLRDCVRFLGEREDVADLVNASDLVLHASTLPEPFGLVVVEAMALGRPLLASRLGGPSEIVTPGSGITFDPQSPRELAHHISRLLRDPEAMRALGSAARLRVRSFHIDQTVAGIERVYADLLGDGDAT
jgi:glycosyltransferase involved in cell wall biosynthesis